MRAFRLSTSAFQFVAFTGEGARLAGGRWNRKGITMVYCSENRTLAAIEFFVNLAPSMRPPDLVVIAAEVPDDAIAVVKIADLPSNWKDYPAPAEIMKIGTKWIESKTSAALLVPSVVTPEERNVLLNPEHPDFRRIKIGKPSKFTYDKRMWK
jgi:RES domain-containing protein